MTPRSVKAKMPYEHLNLALPRVQLCHHAAVGYDGEEEDEPEDFMVHQLDGHPPHHSLRGEQEQGVAGGVPRRKNPACTKVCEIFFNLAKIGFLLSS